MGNGNVVSQQQQEPVPNYNQFGQLERIPPVPGPAYQGWAQVQQQQQAMAAPYNPYIQPMGINNGFLPAPMPVSYPYPYGPPAFVPPQMYNPYAYDEESDDDDDDDTDDDRHERHRRSRRENRPSRQKKKQKDKSDDGLEMFPRVTPINDTYRDRSASSSENGDHRHRQKRRERRR